VISQSEIAKLMLRDIRRERLFNRALQALHCVVGAMWVYLAIDFFLIGSSWTSVLGIVVAFFMYRLFDGSQQRIVRLRDLERRVRALDEQQHKDHK